MTTETIVTKVASGATYAGGSAAVFFGFTANEFAAVVGALVAVIGLAVNVWFKHQHLEIARRNAAASAEDE